MTGRKYRINCEYFVSYDGMIMANKVVNTPGLIPLLHLSTSVQDSGTDSGSVGRAHDWLAVGSKLGVGGNSQNEFVSRTGEPLLL